MRTGVQAHAEGYKDLPFSVQVLTFMYVYIHTFTFLYEQRETEIIYMYKVIYTCVCIYEHTLSVSLPFCSVASTFYVSIILA